MKNLRKFSFMSIIVCFLVLLASCNKKVLDCPSDFSVDLDNKLTWSAVEGARSYSIDIKGLDALEGFEKEYQSRKTAYSLAKLDEGDYEIKIKAIGDSKTGDDSDWSPVFYFHRDYETGCIYTLINNNSEYEITKSGSATGNVRIEDTYRTLPVTRINDGAFKGNGKIETVTLGKYISYIGKNAFYNCSNMTSINIPDSVEFIGESAFQACKSLESISIPDNVTEISSYAFAYCRGLKSVQLNEYITIVGESAFSDCSELQEITLPNSVKSIGTYAFAGDTKLRTVTLSENLTVLPEYSFIKCENLVNVNFGANSNITEFGQEVFSGCSKLADITLPSKLEKIGKRAFYDAATLSNISIPDSVIKIGANSFNGTKLYSSAVDNNDSFVYADKWVVAAVNDGAKIVDITKTTFKEGTVGIADNTFQSLPTLQTVNLTSSIKVVGEMAFNNCSSLWQFKTQENSLEYIWNYAFYGDTILSRLFLNDGLLYVGDQAFANCTLLDNSTLEGDTIIPDTVTNVGTYAFSGTALWDKPTDDGIIYAGNWVVGYSGNGTDVTLKNTTVGIAKYAFYQAENLKSVTGLNYAKYINYGAFYGCSSLSVANLNRNLKKIEDFTFYKCSSLYSVSLPTTLTTIGDAAFYKCSNLGVLDLANTKVTKIGYKAFYGSINIETLTLPETLETIDASAFYGCSSIKEVVLPDTLTTLGDHAFYKCEAIENLVLSNSLTEIASYAFSGCTNIKEINIPDTVKTIGANAFYDCKNATTVSLGNGVEKIYNYAFSNLEKVDELVIPVSVKYVGNFAFKSWKGLTSILLSSNISQVGPHAFYGCKNVTIYTELESVPDTWNSKFNSSYRPVIFGCVLSEDKSYVVSFTYSENSVINPHAKTVTTAEDGTVTQLPSISAPEREGYVFGGWKATITDENGETSEVIYDANSFLEAPEGTVLTAIWNVA